VAEENLAVFCDIFCDITAFDRRESRKILRCARDYGFKLKIHADELSDSGGAGLAADVGCVSADHLIYTKLPAIRAMKRKGVIPVLLPGTALYLQGERKPDLAGFLRTGIPLAIASDFNPGTCMIYSMPTIISLACLLYRMPIEAAITGATVNGARALDLHDGTGMIKPGCKADLMVWSVDNYKKIPYQFGEDMVKTVIRKGKVIHDTDR
jgi:imidazolonepropionase